MGADCTIFLDKQYRTGSRHRYLSAGYGSCSGGVVAIHHLRAIAEGVADIDCIGLTSLSIEFDSDCVGITVLREFADIGPVGYCLRAGTDRRITAAELTHELPMLVDIIIHGIPIEITACGHSRIPVAIHDRARRLVAIIYLCAAGTEEQHGGYSLLVAGTVETGIMARHIVEHLMTVGAVTKVGIIFPVAGGRGASRATLRSIEGEINHRVVSALGEISGITMIPAPGFAGHPEIIRPTFGILVGAVTCTPCGEGLFAGILELIPT